MTEKKADDKRKKVPTAVKRMKQNAKRNLHNRSFKSKVKTAIRSFENALSEGKKPETETHLKTVYSLMDKGVKTHVFKKNKAARTKSRLAISAKKLA